MMPITRPGETPNFYEYAVKYALRPKSGDWQESVGNFDPNGITIPPYQRRIVWKEEEIKEFFSSKSVLFGTIILATVEHDTLILLDGLQRFAIATATLHYLYPLVLSPTPSKKNLAKYFERLSAETSNRQSIIEHNHKSLKDNTRTGIGESYKEFYERIRSVIDAELEENPKEFAEKLIKTFVKKQIAIDTYYGFKDRRELIQTFININSTGMDLTDADLLRSEIVQRAEEMDWDDGDIDDIENEFTKKFQLKIKPAKVLAKHLYDVWGVEPTLVFENWNELKKNDVENLLEFIDHIYKKSKIEKSDKNNQIGSYLYEIFQCGDVPFTIVTWFFYKKMRMEEKHPDTLTDDFYSIRDLHILLRAFYRRVIDGTISRIGPIATKFIQDGGFTIDTAEKLAEKIDPIGKLDIDPDENWIKIGLRKANPDRVKRIFNACLLPNRNDEDGIFCPLLYGNGDDKWNIDHLIPKINKDEKRDGVDEFERIMNFAPLRSKLNKTIKNAPCHIKIGPEGKYVDISHEHPYIKWLTKKHHTDYAKKKLKDDPIKFVLESQELLVINSDPPIGDDRIKQITELLKNKI